MNNSFGRKYGIIFCILSILLGASFVIPPILLLIFELLMTGLAKPFNANVGVVCFFFSLAATCTSTAIYLYALKEESSKINERFFLLLLTWICFLSPLFYYAERLGSKFHLDGQHWMGILPIYIYTCWIYLVFGYYHEKWTSKFMPQSEEASE